MNTMYAVRNQGGTGRTVLAEAALLLRTGVDGAEVAGLLGLGAASMQVALEMQCMTLSELVTYLTGLHGEEGIKASFSTMQLPGILSGVANKRLQKAYREQPSVARVLCRETTLPNFKPSERYGVVDMGELEPVAADGEIRHGQLGERKAVNRLVTYAKTFTLTREAIINDDLHALLRLPAMFGTRASRLVDQTFFRRLLSNPGGMFSAENRNLLTGTDSALSVASLSKAVTMFADQVDEDGNPLNIQPKYLLVPPSLKMPAREILGSPMLLATGATAARRIPTYNPLAEEDIEILCSPWLSNPRLPGHSETAWYLFADKEADTFDLALLRGQKAPVVEAGGVHADLLGMSFRVYFDFGVSEVDFRTMLRSDGQ